MKVLYENAFEASPELIARAITDRQHLSRDELEAFLRSEITDYPTRRLKFWNCDFSSIEAFIASVEPNRNRWRDALGIIEPTAEMAANTYPAFENERVIGEWIEVQVWENVYARAIFARPKGATGKLPLVIAQHGISSSPEHIFGFVNPQDVYWAFGMRLLDAGYAVIAPLLTTDGAYRSRIDRLCRLLVYTIQGLEIAKIKRLIDWASEREDIDSERIAMWGLSMGGFYTLITTPVELRIKVAIIAAFFNHRVNKMAIEDPRYSCFLPTPEEYIFIRGWLREFSDRDLLALICPRPVQIQCGKCDAVLWWPQVVEEFEAGKAYYQALGIPDRCELCLHHGGHEIVIDEGMHFLEKWL